MSFLCRIRQSSKLKTHLRNFVFPTSQITHEQISPLGTDFGSRNYWVLGNQDWVLISSNNNTQLGFRNSVRFFAAPAQAKQQEEDNSGPRLNQQITAPFVRLVSSEGHAVVSRQVALEQARRQNLDLVEVQKDAKPPVCKIMDYHKEKYEKQVKKKENLKNKSKFAKRKGVCKDVRIALKIEKRDMQMKADSVKRLMEEGYRVKCMVVGTGNQDLDEAVIAKQKQEMGQLLSTFSALIDDVSIIESGPMVEKKQAYIVVRHIQFGPPKKGGKKVAGQSPQSSSKSKKAEESDSEGEDGIIISEQGEDVAKSSTWSVFDADNDADEVFELEEDVNTTCGQLEAAPDSSLPFATENRYRTTQGMTSSPPVTPTENRYKAAQGTSSSPPTTPPQNRYKAAQGTSSSPPVMTQNRYSAQGTSFPPVTSTHTRYSAQGTSSPPAQNRYSAAQGTSSSPPVALTQNRYNGAQGTSSSPPAAPTENRYKSGPGRDMRSPTRFDSKIQNPGRQNVDPNAPELPVQTENRYKSAQGNRYGPMYGGGSDVRNPSRFEPRFQNNGQRPQFDFSNRPPIRKTEGFPPKETAQPTIPVSPTENRYKK